MGKLCELFFIVLMVSLTVCQDSANTESVAAFGPEDQAIEFQTKVLGIVASRVVAANLPEDLQISASQVLADVADGLDACQEAIKLSQMIWQYKMCSSLQLRLALRRISALESLAALRSTTVAPQ